MIDKLVNYIKDDSLKIKYVNNTINVVNYDSVLEVKEDVITIIKDKKVIVIQGSDLKLNKLLDNEVLITGIINKIEL